MSLQGKRMQTKTSKSKRTETREETAEKVKAIREKQNQWMKEREAIKSSTPKSKNALREQVPLPGVQRLRSGANSGRSIGGSSDSSNRNLYSNPRRKPLYPEPKRDHSDIVSWISKGDNPVAKKQRPPSASTVHGNEQGASKIHLTRDASSENVATAKQYLASNYGGFDSQESSSSIALSASKIRPSSRSAMESNIGLRENDKRFRGFNDSDFLDTDAAVSGSNVNKSVSETDDMVNGSNSATSIKTQNMSPDMLNALADSVAERLKATLQPGHKQNRQSESSGESSIESHHCPLCKEQMTAPRHTPFAVIPCGHTYCQSCLHDCKKCPTCQTVIRSTAVNTVLQQIITDFKAQKEKERLQKLEEQTRHYVEEYQSLALRCNALNGEAESILNTMEAVTEQILDEKKLMKKLEMDEQELKQKISRLQAELDGVKVREEDCQERCNDLEQKYNEEKQRLAMIEDTVKTIGKSKERVKMMVHNFAPSLNLDDYD